MPLEDRDIFTAIFEKYRDQPIEFVMAQYEKAKLLNREIELRLSALDGRREGDDPAAACAAASTETPPAAEEKAVVEPPRKRPTKRDLVADPEKAFTDETITCCLCGRQFNTLTARHLKSHNVSVDEYKYLCGYAPSQKLMSFNLAATMARNVQKAQAARKALLQKKDAGPAEAAETQTQEQ